MRPVSRLVTPVMRGVLSLLCRVDSSELARVPQKGPLIVVVNHVNFLEVPALYSFFYPREAIGLIKRETWENPVLAALAWVWGAIPLDRAGTDLKAMRLCLDVLARGGMLLLAPEGTRSGDGVLRQGHGGVVQIALRSGAPILPVAHTGGERFWDNLKSCRRTRFRFRVGRPYRLVPPEGAGVSKGVRADMTESMMNSIAALLPLAQRGAYPHPETAPMRYVEWLDGPVGPAGRR